MDEFLAKIYLEQAKQECERCFHSIQIMNAITQKKLDDDFFQHALDLIHHAAAVSRIFWPPGGKNKQSTKRAHRRGQALRDMLQLQSGHAVQNRSLRDHFEHFDERLDDWAENSRNRNIVHRLFGPRSAIGGVAIQDSDIIHHFDPATKIFGFRGEHYNIQELATGIDDIYQKTIAKIEELDANKALQRTSR
ncbi:hypothetical protein [Paraglaciecola hydrolytica]|uniref:Uncharacterized protein n=1 Tax=Paraglaciecola hydrolytica TaxID=1799789 RepID=A0A136A6K2_9ALTE|nr:hypothetical protein [Paraglaciecola hydrolytica]KXI30857.1 hypothetical protein AX660_05495 [Paraglaciecola hydrolytica]